LLVYTPGNSSNNITISWGTATYTSFSTYQSQTGMDANSMYADPQFTNSSSSTPDFHLPGTSVCINAGDPGFIAGNNETDFYGGARIVNSKVDIGAHESSAVNPVNEKKNETGVSFFPNPSSDRKFTIYVINFPAQLQLCDLSGRLILETTLNSSSNLINLDNEQNGIYFCKIILPDGTACTGKLIIQ